MSLRPNASPSSEPRELPLLLGAGAGDVETLLLIGEPDAAARVLVRRWTASDWSAPPRTEHEPAAELLRWLERQASASRSMNQSLYAVRRWLLGEPHSGGAGAATGPS